MTATHPVPTSDPWIAQLQQLRGRYEHLRPGVLAALTALVLDENVSLDDAKAQAGLRCIRITAASMNAARRVLSRMDSSAAPASAPTTATPKREPRRPRTAEKAVDTDRLIRGFVAKLQTQGGAEAERLREAMRKAISVLQAAVG